MGKTEKKIKHLLLFFFVFLSVFLLTAQEEKAGEEGQKEAAPAAEAAAPAAPAAPVAPAAPPKPLRTNLFFRYGKLLAAEAVTEKPAISDATRQMRLASGAVYAQLVFRADRGRSISIHDFVLADEGGKEYKCIALAEGKEPYSGLNWIFRDTNGTTLYRMLFALPSAQGKFKLVFKLSSDREMDFFLLREKSSFSGNFPENGNLLLPKPPPPPPPPAPPAEEKKEEEKKEGNEPGKEENKGEEKGEKAP